jgi:hypothetical protein
LADVLDDVGRLGSAVGADVLDDVRGHLELTAVEVVLAGGWSEPEPLRLAKGPVTWLLRCPRRAVAPAGAGLVPGDATADDLVLGIVVDAAAKLAALGARRPITARGAVAYAAASGDERPLEHVAALAAPRAGGGPAGPAGDGVGAKAGGGPAGEGGEAGEGGGVGDGGGRGEGDGDRFLVEAETRVARVVAAVPPVDPSWWPRVEEPVRVRLAGGAVVVTGRLDVLLGGPPTERPGIVVEVKGGRWYDGMRADAHLYALLVGLRDGVAPAGVVTLVADGTTHVEPIRPGLLTHAGERLEQALRTAAALAAGEVPEARPGAHCAHCPVRPDCPAALDPLAPGSGSGSGSDCAAATSDLVTGALR